jgi:hypothetical protein
MLRSENSKAWRRLNFGAGLLSAPVTAAALDTAIAAYDAADVAEVCGCLRIEASADDYAAAYLQLYTKAIGEAVAQDSSQAAATAVWLEDLLPSAAPRVWLDVAGETGLALEACFGRRRAARMRALLRSLPFSIRSRLERWRQ